MAHDHHHAPDLSAGNLTGSSLAMHARNCGIAAVAFLVGVLLERWLFFAQAEHVVRLYHGQQSV
jgi:hypothetical protein